MALSVETKWTKFLEFMKREQEELTRELMSTAVARTGDNYEVALRSIPPRLALLAKLQNHVEQLNRGDRPSEVKLPPLENR